MWPNVLNHSLAYSTPFAEASQQHYWHLGYGWSDLCFGSANIQIYCLPVLVKFRSYAICWFHWKKYRWTVAIFFHLLFWKSRKM